MNYFDIKAKLEVILLKKKIRMTLLVMLPIVVLYGARILGMFFTTSNELTNYLISLGLSIVGILVSNLVYFYILKNMREEDDHKKLISFSMKHLPIQIALGVLYTLVRFALDTLLSIFGIMIPFIYLPINLCLMILYFALECTLAYCAYDEGINVGEIMRGCFMFVKAKARIIIRCGLPYLISYFLYVIGLASVLSNTVQMQDGVMDVARTIEYIASDPLSGTVLSILGLTLIFWIMFAYFEMRVFAATALLFDENKPLYFSRMKHKINKFK